jgi:hypothetical protein
VETDPTGVSSIGLANRNTLSSSVGAWPARGLPQFSTGVNSRSFAVSPWGCVHVGIHGLSLGHAKRTGQDCPAFCIFIAVLGGSP